MDTVIQVENISKLYRLGTIGTGSLRQDITFWWNHSVRKKQNSFFQLAGEQPQNGNGQFIWALQDINFDVAQGDVLGIIGSNGSGKSTLLKIISRIIRPTKGVVRGRGKVSSLLEVGTGFHQELTGRENIFISGSILGMRKGEIEKKFDEIIAFSGIEKFIDTPVKRYSSGMYVRLAFAVAAHLEPDILIVDEVLAVGDAEFQKKCLGKMREVSQTKGRTILFVSHNMQAINNLCNRAVWLQKGKQMETGETSVVVNKYLAGVQKQQLGQSWEITEAPGNEFVRFKQVELIPQHLQPDAPLDIRTPLKITFQFWNYTVDTLLNVELALFTISDECIFVIPSEAAYFQKGLIKGECTLPGNFLNSGSYYITLTITKDTTTTLFDLDECLSFEVEDYRGDTNYFGKWSGAVRPRFPIKLEQVKNDLSVNLMQ